MTMDYQGNSNKNKGKDSPVSKDDIPAKKVEKVIEGAAIQRKKPLRRRMHDVFFGGDFSGAAHYIASDVFLPAIRNLIVDAAQKGIERVIFGESNAPRRGTGYGPKIQYNSPIHRSDPRDRSAYLPQQPDRNFTQNRREANEIVLGTREEAAVVLERMLDILDQYEAVTLSDLYELVGIPSSHVDQKWGWTYLHNSQIRQVREGFMLSLPTMEAL